MGTEQSAQTVRLGEDAAAPWRLLLRRNTDAAFNRETLTERTGCSEYVTPLHVTVGKRVQRILVHHQLVCLFSGFQHLTVADTDCPVPGGGTCLSGQFAGTRLWENITTKALLRRAYCMPPCVYEKLNLGLLKLINICNYKRAMEFVPQLRDNFLCPSRSDWS